MDDELQAVVKDQTKVLEDVRTLATFRGDAGNADVKTTLKTTTSMSAKQTHLEGVSDLILFK